MGAMVSPLFRLLKFVLESGRIKGLELLMGLYTMTINDFFFLKIIALIRLNFLGVV